VEELFRSDPHWIAEGTLLGTLGPKPAFLSPLQKEEILYSSGFAGGSGTWRKGWDCLLCRLSGNGFARNVTPPRKLGRGGIRTHGRFNPTHDFESCALNRTQPPFLTEAFRGNELGLARQGISQFLRRIRIPR
jgi:hypothetical protein